jgi:Lrp/AsnC family leucine-responsive transcriptional regulator
VGAKKGRIVKKRQARSQKGQQIARAVELDRFDLIILTAIQRNNLQPLREIARAVNLSAPAVARRLQRLRTEGVVCQDVSVLDAVLVGRPLTLIVEVSVESELVEKLDEVRERFLECREIQQCYYVTGEVDFVLIITLANMEEYEMLTRKLFFAGGNVKHFKTFVAMQRVKVTTSLPLDQPTGKAVWK